MKIEFHERMASLVAMRGEYKADAYRYIYHIANPPREYEYDVPEELKPKNLSARMLYKRLCQQAIKDYGPMAGMIFRSWGLNTTYDIARATFNMVEFGLLERRGRESAADFNNLPPLMETLTQPYE